MKKRGDTFPPTRTPECRKDGVACRSWLLVCSHALVVAWSSLAVIGVIGHERTRRPTEGPDRRRTGCCFSEPGSTVSAVSSAVSSRYFGECARDSSLRRQPSGPRSPLGEHLAQSFHPFVAVLRSTMGTWQRGLQPGAGMRCGLHGGCVVGIRSGCGDAARARVRAVGWKGPACLPGRRRDPGAHAGRHRRSASAFAERSSREIGGREPFACRCGEGTRHSGIVGRLPPTPDSDSAPG